MDLDLLAEQIEADIGSDSSSADDASAEHLPEGVFVLQQCASVNGPHAAIGALEAVVKACEGLQASSRNGCDRAKLPHSSESSCTSYLGRTIHDGSNRLNDRPHPEIVLESKPVLTRRRSYSSSVVESMGNSRVAAMSFVPTQDILDKQSPTVVSPPDAVASSQDSATPDNHSPPESTLTTEETAAQAKYVFFSWSLT